MIIPLIILIFSIKASLSEDQIINPPVIQSYQGFPLTFSKKIYSGYLKTQSPDRQLHYIFIESQGSTSDPVVLWLNGGPGCSSLIGFLTEVGPYHVDRQFSPGNYLIQNPYTWNKKAHLLFLQSPAGVGFSINTNQSYQYDDKKTADDAFAALKYFFTQKAAEYQSRDFYVHLFQKITGQSYAGKYVPDIAIRILQNAGGLINLKGILVGNGVMNFQHESLYKSQAQYMYFHNFLSIDMARRYQLSCQTDWTSPRCGLFKAQFASIRRRFNVYNVYEICTQSSTLGQQEALQKYLNYGKRQQQKKVKRQQISEAGFPLCFKDDGMISYLNYFKKEYNIKSTKSWQPCDNIHYYIGEDGSIEQYNRILKHNSIKVWLFSGDWDDQVPLDDTIKNLRKLNVQKQKDSYKPWFFHDQHFGFVQNYSNKLSLVTVKKASHMVPQSQPGPAYKLFQSFIQGRSLTN